MENVWNNLTEQIKTYAPNLLAAIGVLIAGWLIALAASFMTRKLLNNSNRDQPQGPCGDVRSLDEDPRRVLLGDRSKHPRALSQQDRRQTLLNTLSTPSEVRCAAPRAA